MYLILTASKDNYITNKVVSNSSSSLSNVGQSSTLDLFKLSSETFTPKIHSTARFKFTSTSVTDGVILTITDAENNTVKFEFDTETNTSNGSILAGNNIAVGINGANTLSSLSSRLASAINGVNSLNQSPNQTLNITAKSYNNGTVYLTQNTEGLLGDKQVLVDTNNFLEVSNFRMREHSKALIGFDLSNLQNIFNINSVSNFNCSLKLFDVTSGHQKPKNVDYILRPLSKSFDEGIGKDTSFFSDYDVSNYLTSSYDRKLNSYNTWDIKGAEFISGSSYSSSDALNQYDPDLINLESTFTDVSGDSNLSFDVSGSIVQMLKGNLSTTEFLLHFSESLLFNDSTYFVKRLGSTNIKSKLLKPQLHISFDDTVVDSRDNLYFDTNHSIFLENRKLGKLSNINVGSNSGVPKVMLKLLYGSNQITDVTSSNDTNIKGSSVDGRYKVNITGSQVSRFNTNLKSDINNSTSGSANLKGVWYLNDSDNTLILSESLTFKISDVSPANRNIILRDIITTEYEDFFLINQLSRIFVEFIDIGKQHESIKLPSRLKGINVGDVLYRVVDSSTGKTIINFHENGTKLSTKDNKYFFDFYGSSLLKNRNIKFDFKLVSMDSRIIKNKNNYTVK